MEPLFFNTDFKDLYFIKYNSKFFLFRPNLWIEFYHKNPKEFQENLRILFKVFEFKKLKFNVIYHQEEDIKSFFLGIKEKFTFKKVDLLKERMEETKSSILDLFFRQKFRKYSLTLLKKNQALLLGWKKKGLGEYYYNGFGGKVNPKEKVIDAAKREVWEETGLEVEDLVFSGKLHFLFLDPQKPNVKGYVFLSEKFSSEPKETDEMIPQWFTLPEVIQESTISELFEKLPFSQMWEDDPFWFSYLFRGYFFVGYFLMNEKNQILKMALKIRDPCKKFKK
ncbi:MAG: 8-oxo-dGTP diphosphatase [Leptospiraceae bacterium]|nr:8-oxo-dGTP diphosphatase [Leptospiraceae bacterium]MDW7977140.1 8-oxo-dGTP diphosphatase [Leptospiraceae bacterium]